MNTGVKREVSDIEIDSYGSADGTRMFQVGRKRERLTHVGYCITQCFLRDDPLQEYNNATRHSCSRTFASGSPLPRTDRLDLRPSVPRHKSPVDNLDARRARSDRATTTSNEPGSDL